MILTIEQPHAEVDDRIPGQITAPSGVLNSFLHCGDVLPRNRSSEDLVDELEVPAARQRLDLDLAIGELSVAA